MKYSLCVDYYTQMTFKFSSLWFDGFIIIVHIFIMIMTTHYIVPSHECSNERLIEKHFPITDFHLINILIEMKIT